MNWHQLSLRRTLLLVLLPGMLVVVGAQLWLTWQTAVDASNAAYDRSLLGAIKSTDANISTDSGGLSVELPYRLLEFFELTASGQVYYRVATEDGLVEIGNADMPAPKQPLETGKPQFMDAMYYGEPVRLGSYARMLSRPIAGQQTTQRVVIPCVADTGLDARSGADPGDRCLAGPRHRVGIAPLEPFAPGSSESLSAGFDANFKHQYPRRCAAPGGGDQPPY
jgi:two-component system sensor histidine kinase TctE